MSARAASEAIALDQAEEALVAQATGLSRATIQAGMQEFEQPTPAPMTRSRPLLSAPRSYGAQWRNRVRLQGGERKLTEVKDPAILSTLEKLLTNEVGGDPMSDRRWVRSSLRQLCEWLNDEGHPASATVVSRLLKKMGYSLKANQRKQGQSRANCPERDEKSRHIASQREDLIAAKWPFISVDTKKRELIGNLRRPGSACIPDRWA